MTANPIDIDDFNFDSEICLRLIFIAILIKIQIPVYSNRIDLFALYA